MNNLLPLALSLFAQDAPPDVNPNTPWTTKEIVYLGIWVTAVAIPLMGGLWRYFWVSRGRKRAEKEARGLRADLAKLRARLDKIEKNPEPDGLDVTDLVKQLQTAKEELGRLQLAHSQSKEEAAAQRAFVAKLNADLTEWQDRLKQHQGELAEVRRRVQRAVSKTGLTWQERVYSTAPEFKPLDPDTRRVPIVSVLNLKGGVGKTTITANLGAALDRLGYRVLMVDLDLQGSLTGLYFPEQLQEQAGNEDRLLHPPARRNC